MNLVSALQKLDSSLLIPTPDGAFTVSLQGRMVHSTRAPLVEAERLLKDMTLVPEECIIILWGVGLGYHAEILLNKGYKIIAIELRPELASIFKQVFPIEKLLAFIEKEDDQELFHALVRLDSRKNYKFVDILMRGVTASSVLIRLADKGKKALKSTHNIHSYLMDSWYYNIIKNLHFLQQNHVGITFSPFLQNQYTVLCSAGPSLKESLPYIKKNRDFFTVLSVDTALSTLLEADIIPDFVHSVDAKIHNISDFSGIPDSIFCQMTLIADITLSHAVIQLPWKQIYFVSTAQPIFDKEKGYILQRIELMQYLWDKGLKFPELQTGGSVANSLYHAALLFGAEKIFLVGQDLAYTNHRGHAIGSPYDKEYRYRINRLQSLDTIHCHKIPDWKTRAIDGGYTYTDPLLDQFRQWFETSLQDNQDIVEKSINASEGGAYFLGWKHEPLSQFSYNLSKVSLSSMEQVPLFLLSDILKVLIKELKDNIMNYNHPLVSEYFYKELYSDTSEMLPRKMKKIQKLLDGLS